MCLLLQTPEHLKTETGEEACNPDGLAQRSISLLKDTFPDIEVSPLEREGSLRQWRTAPPHACPQARPALETGPGKLWCCGYACDDV